MAIKMIRQLVCDTPVELTALALVALSGKLVKLPGARQNAWATLLEFPGHRSTLICAVLSKELGVEVRLKEVEDLLVL